MTMVTTNQELRKALQYRVDSGEEVAVFTLSLLDAIEEGCTCGAATTYPGNDEIHTQDLSDEFTGYVADGSGNLIPAPSARALTPEEQAEVEASD